MPPKEESKGEVASAASPVYIPPVGISIMINEQDTDKCVETAVRMWAAECPDEVRAFKRQQERERAMLKNDLGMTDDKTWSRYIEVPVSLAHYLSQMLPDRWKLDDRILRKLVKACPMVLVRKRRREGRVIV